MPEAQDPGLALWLIVLGAAVIGVGGVPGLVLPRDSRLGARLALVLHLIGAGAGLAGTILALAATPTPRLDARWGIPLGSVRLEVDGLSAAFLVPILVVPALAGAYGCAGKGPGRGAGARALLGALSASMVLLAISRDGVLFVICWEVMALSAYFLIVSDGRRAEARHAGWIYLVASHIAALVLIALLAALHAATGSTSLDPIPSGAASAGWGMWVLMLGVLALGLKAGLVPMHVWLPGAHAAAPSHVSAILSGVVLKTGVYGLARLAWMLPEAPAGAGWVLLVLGGVSALAGVILAIAQHDLKRLLAYHSIENIGIIAMGLGLALLGRATGRSDWTTLGLAAAVLHSWNHALFKSLLFLAAGHAVHETRTRELDRMGGLARSMPATAGLFIVGSVAICGLPPLNGLVSELLLFLGLLRTLHPGDGPAAPWAALGAPVLGMAGALALACFAKVIGVVFLGEPRHARRGREAPAGRLVPMAILAGACAALGLLPVAAVPFLDAAGRAWSPREAAPIMSLAPLWQVSVVASGTWVGAAVAFLVLRRLARGAERAPTWGCGYAAASARMQYTASSFAQILVGAFAFMLRPRARVERPEGLFPARASLRTHVPDAVLDEAILPAAGWVSRQVSRVRALQAGRSQAYILYVLIAVLALVLWAVAWPGDHGSAPP